MSGTIVSSPAGVQKPTHARYWVIVFAVTLSVLAYIDRVSISMAAPDMMRDLGLSKVQMGYVFSAFALAYSMCEIPGGWMGDWLGPKRVLIRIVLWWSTFTALTGWAWNMTSLWVVRFLFGAGEAGCFPNLTKSFTTWLPHRERVRAQGIMWTFARWGGAFTPPLVILVFNYMSWRGAFHAFGVLGLVWCVLFWRWFKDNPRNHKSVNEGELALLADSEKYASGHGDVPWRKFISSRSVWLLWAQYFFLSYPWCFYITWLPTYLKEWRHLDLAHASRLAVFPLLFGGFGSLFAGMIAAKMARWMNSTRKARCVLACVGFTGAGTLIILSINLKDPLWAMLAMGMASFSNDLVMPGAWGACMDIGGKYAGTLSGSMNMMGNFAGFVGPTAMSYILRWTGGNWDVNLYVMAGVYLLGILCWPFLDSVTPLEQENS